MDTTITIHQYMETFRKHLASGGKTTDRVRKMSTGNLIVFRDGKVLKVLPVERTVGHDPKGLITAVRFTFTPGELTAPCCTAEVYGTTEGKEQLIISYDANAYDYNEDDFIGKTLIDAYSDHERLEVKEFDGDCTEGRIEHVSISMENDSSGLLGTVIVTIDGKKNELFTYKNVGEYNYSIDHFLRKTAEQAVKMHLCNEVLVNQRINERKL